jgi:hypothetical protein
MPGPILIASLAAGLALLGPVGGAIAADDAAGSTRDAEVALARDEDDGGVLATVDDDPGDGDGGDDTGSFTSGVDSNDGTNSRASAVSRDTDRSRGDLTRDRTKDGPVAATRDPTAGSTNDGSRHDTR